MDDYGIAASALAGLRVYEAAARGSGRTMRLLGSLSGGETIVCASEEEAREICRCSVRVLAKTGLYQGAGMSKPAAVGVARSLGEAYGKWRRPLVFSEQFVVREFEREVTRLAAEFGTHDHRPDPRLPPDVPPPVSDRSSRSYDRG